jgi:ABC-2 type transport system permease protein/oleandomycin transport system permease protein
VTLPAAVSDGLALTRRNLLHYVRVPSLVIFSTVTPVMLVVLFAFVFGGAIPIPGLRYLDYLMPGVFVQAVAFGAIQTGIGLADDHQRGIIDRFRSLPMARSAVLAGRTLSDCLRNLLVVVLMTTVGLLIGFRFDAGLGAIVGGLGLIVLLAFAFSFVSAAVGLSVGNVEAAQSAGFVWVFPLTFASSAFVPIFTMPGWLQAFAKVNPVTITVDAVRQLFFGQPAGTRVWQTLGWMAAILVVFVPLSVSRYRRS